MQNVAECASRIRRTLDSHGSLTLWEVKAILNETRDATLQILFWMASRNEITCRPTDKELSVILSSAGRQPGSAV